MTQKPPHVWFGSALALAVAVALLLGCGDVKRTAPSKACTKAYEQCVMPTGVLGVCNLVDCAEGQPAPCLVCRSQH
jgi:hypothetical protein